MKFITLRFWHNFLFRLVREPTAITNLRSTIGTPQARTHRVLAKHRFSWSLAALVACFALLHALPLRAADPANVTFSLDFPGSDPDHYSISVRSDGHARYECSAKISTESDDRDNYQTEFTFSDAARARIFDLAAQAHYFSSKIDSGNRKLANTGAKKLSYKDGQREFTAAYNFSPQPAVQQLTTLFQSVSATLEFGRHLAYYHRYQKLALDDELKRMEDRPAEANSSNCKPQSPFCRRSTMITRS